MTALLSFLAGVIVMLAYVRLQHRHFRNVLISIHDGYAIPDENGNLGWLRKRSKP